MANVDAMGCEVNAGVLAARVQKSFPGDVSPQFHLDLNVQIPAGITILFGPSGAGKSTLLDCIAGLTSPDAGRIAIDCVVALLLLHAWLSVLR